MVAAALGSAGKSVAAGAAGCRGTLLCRSLPLLQSSESSLLTRLGALQQQQRQETLLQRQQTLLQQQQTLLQQQRDSGAASRVGDFVYRWLDVTGSLTRWHSRKAWVLELDPYSRLAAPLITEYERKMIMFVGLHAYLFFGIALYLVYKGHAHGAVKPPVPLNTDFPGIDGRKKDFTWHGRLFFIAPKERCKECRWLDLECKKSCFEALKAQGRRLVLNGGNPLSVPRAVLEPPHHH